MSVKEKKFSLKEKIRRLDYSGEYLVRLNRDGFLAFYEDNMQSKKPIVALNPLEVSGINGLSDGNEYGSSSVGCEFEINRTITIRLPVHEWDLKVLIRQAKTHLAHNKPAAKRTAKQQVSKREMRLGVR